jgi:peptidyl-prolyl cis-trans isomerase B (cyclophilin B)
MKKIITLVLLSLFLFSCTNKNVEEKANLDINNKKQMSNYKEGDVVAIMKTTNGTINILLETGKAPITSTNFIGLAKQGYYDGVIFHRIIKDFMIQ